MPRKPKKKKHSSRRTNRTISFRNLYSKQVKSPIKQCPTVILPESSTLKTNIYETELLPRELMRIALSYLWPGELISTDFTFDVCLCISQQIHIYGSWHPTFDSEPKLYWFSQKCHWVYCIACGHVAILLF